jgi:type I restriction enzyme R subunit
MLKNVNDDPELRKLIHNMMEMDGGTMMKNVTSVCMAMFGEKYISMSKNDWRHLIDDYVRKVTNLPDLREDEVFRYVIIG